MPFVAEYSQILEDVMPKEVFERLSSNYSIQKEIIDIPKSLKKPLRKTMDTENAENIEFEIE